MIPLPHGYHERLAHDEKEFRARLRERAEKKGSFFRSPRNRLALPRMKMQEELMLHLERLAYMRGSSLEEAVPAIAETITQLWMLHQGDPFLYVSRIEDPWEAEARVRLGTDELKLKLEPVLRDDPDFHLHNVAVSVHSLLGHGVTIADVLNFVEQTSEAWRSEHGDR